MTGFPQSFSERNPTERICFRRERLTVREERTKIGNIPAIVFGEKSDRAYLFVHGKMSSKEAARDFAKIAAEKGYRTLSFDLPGHGERAAENERCDVWNGVRDLKAACAYAFDRWKQLSLYACSLGAYFSLNACAGCAFRKCLFQSPIVDMEALIGRMMTWFQVSEERLEREKEIDTPIDVLSWEYYRYVKAHPVMNWPFPTKILYAGRDNLQSREEMEAFSRRFGCALTVSEESLHPFMEPGDAEIVEAWLRENL